MINGFGLFKDLSYLKIKRGFIIRFVLCVSHDFYRQLIREESSLAVLIVFDLSFLISFRRKVCVKRKISRRSTKLMVFPPLQEEKSLCRLPTQSWSHTQIMFATHFAFIM